MQGYQTQSNAANEQHPKLSQETNLWNRIKNQFSKTTDRGRQHNTGGRQKQTPVIYIEPHIEDSKMQRSRRHQPYEEMDSTHLSPHHRASQPRLSKPNQSKSDQMLSRLLKDQLQLAYSDHQNNVRCAQSHEALMQLRHSQPRLELTPSSSRPASPTRKSKSQNASPSLSRRSLSPLNHRLLDGGSSGSENSFASNYSAPVYYQVGRSRSCNTSRTHSPDHRIPQSNGLSRKAARIMRQSSVVAGHQVARDSSQLVKQAHINRLWEFIIDAVNAAQLEDFSDSDPKQWWRKLFQTLKLMHGKAKASNIAEQLMGNPKVLEAIQNKLAGMVGEPSGYLDSLPEFVKKRIKALKKLQFECTKIEAEFCEEIHKLECKFADKYRPIYHKRKEIIAGLYEPDEGECDWPSDEEDEEDVENEQKNGAKKLKTVDEPSEPTKGIQSFWATTFKNVELLNGMIQEHDEPVLDSLMNVQLELNSDPMGFTLLFEFDENEYFTDKVLTKTYTMQSSADENDPFGFEGPEIISCKGCSIHWKEGKNVTLMNMKKKQKNAKTGNIRIVTKEVQVDSFFNFFSPPEVPEDPSAEIDADVEALLQADFQIGHFIRERIVPHAVLYFTGDIDTDDEEDGEGDDDMDEDYEDYDEECDPDYDPSKDVQGGKDCKSQ